MLRFGFLPFLYYVTADCLRFYKHRSISTEILLKQIKFTGVEAFNLILMLASVISIVIVVQGYPILFAVGQQALIYDILIAGIVRDGGPFIVCFIVLARSGTAISTELGNMVFNKEIDALTAMGISAISYLVVPRVIGMLFSVVILSSYFMAIGLLAGFVSANAYMQVSFSVFINSLLAAIHPIDIAIMLLKVSISGIFIALICSFHGLKVNKAITEVPQRNIKAVGQSLLLISSVHLLITLTYLYLSEASWI